MSSFRLWIGLVGAALIGLSALPHGLQGWARMRDRLLMLDAPADLVLGFKLVWVLSDVAMLAFGLLAGWPLWRRLRGHDAAMLPTLIVALAYGGYGIWAVAASGYDLGFLVFVIPALMLLAAVSDRRPTRSGP